MDGSDRGRARAGTGRLRLAGAALEDADLDLVRSGDADKLDIDAVLEVVMAADLGSLRLPARQELVGEDHEVRIADVHRNAVGLAEGQLDGKRLAGLRLTHRHLETEQWAGTRGLVRLIFPATQ